MKLMKCSLYIIALISMTSMFGRPDKKKLVVAPSYNDQAHCEKNIALVCQKEGASSSLNTGDVRTTEDDYWQKGAVHPLPAPQTVARESFLTFEEEAIIAGFLSDIKKQTVFDGGQEDIEDSFLQPDGESCKESCKKITFDYGSSSRLLSQSNEPQVIEGHAEGSVMPSAVASAIRTESRPSLSQDGERIHAVAQLMAAPTIISATSDDFARAQDIIAALDVSQSQIHEDKN